MKNEQFFLQTTNPTIIIKNFFFRVNEKTALNIYIRISGRPPLSSPISHSAGPEQASSPKSGVGGPDDGEWKTSPGSLLLGPVGFGEGLPGGSVRFLLLVSSAGGASEDSVAMALVCKAILTSPKKHGSWTRSYPSVMNELKHAKFKACLEQETSSKLQETLLESGNPLMWIVELL